MTNKSINEILIAVQENNPDLSDEDLRHCLKAVRVIDAFLWKELLKNYSRKLRDWIGIHDVER